MEVSSFMERERLASRKGMGRLITLVRRDETYVRWKEELPIASLSRLEKTAGSMAHGLMTR
jgi:hypothetical protein